MIDRCEELIAKAGLMVALLAGCSVPPMFSVAVDEPIVDGRMTLNGASARLMKNLDGAYWAKWREVPGKGEIVVFYADGTSASCKIAYIPGTTPQHQAFAIHNRKCVSPPDHGGAPK